MKMNAIFDQTLESSGPDYLQYERQLLEGKEPETSQMLSRRLGDSDPMVRLTAQAFLDGKGPWAKDHREASEYLQSLPGRLEYSIIQNPPPLMLSRSLASDFNDHVANFLALKLVKDVKERKGVSPNWLKQGVILYLQQQKKPSTTAGLIRFAEETDDLQLRDSAIEAIKSIPDPELPGKIEAERRWAQAQGKELPPALDALRNTGPK